MYLQPIKCIQLSNILEFDVFLSKSIDSLYSEVDNYITKNNDQGIFFYANENSLSGLFVNGLIRNDGPLRYISAIQDYSLFDENNNHKRPDIFLKVGEFGIWIESKYDKYKQFKEGTIGNVNAWLNWDSEEPFAQVKRYYDIEKKGVNEFYTHHILMTLCFKLIKCNPDVHSREIEDMLRPSLEIRGDRYWYYSCAFFGKTESEHICLEVYGTFQQVK